MRQAGHLAAAGIVALDTCIDRLKDDHANAKRLAKGLAGMKGCKVDLASVETNMVMVDVSGTGKTSDQWVAAALALGVQCLNRDAGPTVRFVTHRNVSRDDVDEALERLARLR